MPIHDSGALSRRLRSGRLGVLVALAAVALGVGRGTTALSAENLKVGDLAPAFSLPGSDGRTYTLADFKGKQAVVLAWFPKAFTGG
jgi:peroxiredoxin Q/BCP